MGKWYVIASKPNLIEKNCKCARTTDTRIDAKTIELAETCVMLGKWITSKSKAIIEEENTGRWTNVNYGLKADYWVIDIEEDSYSWTVIG
jgi:lipocalin